MSSPTADEGECTIIGGANSLRILVETWAIVVAAKGEDDEPEYAVDFADQAKKFYDEVDDEDACEGTQLAVDAAALNFEATLLATPFKTQPPSNPKANQYKEVAKAGNQLLESAGLNGARFLAPDCHGRVDNTKACTALEN